MTSKILVDTLQEIFAKNLAFLSQHFPDLHLRVNELNILLQTGAKEPKYELEFFPEGGYFDIVNLNDESYYYAINSYVDADNRTEQLNHTKADSFDLLHRQFNDTNKLSEALNFYGALPFIKYINNHVDPSTVTFKKIFKYIFMGVGLGFHVHQMYQKIKPMVTLIIEPELEVFRLSLFVIDYSEFLDNERKLFLSVEDTEQNFNIVVSQFIMYQSYFNYIVKYHMLTQNCFEYIDKIRVLLSSNSLANFPYSAQIEGFKRTVHYANDGIKFLNFNFLNNTEMMSKVPFLLLGAGPSVSKQIEWLQTHQNKFCLVVVDSIVPSLLKNNIIPDIVVVLDPSDIKSHAFHDEHLHLLEKTIIICTSQVHQSVVKKFSKKQLYMAQVYIIDNDCGAYTSSPNVGAYALQFPILFGAKTIYTLGNDAALDTITGHLYADDSLHNNEDEKYSVATVNNGSNVFTSDTVLEVKGNFQETVLSTLSLNDIRISYERLIPAWKINYDFELFNLSDGAYIEGMAPLKCQDIKLNHSFDKYLMMKELSEHLIIASKIIEVQNFAEDFLILDGILRRLNQYNKVKVKNQNQFLLTKLELLQWILEEKKKMSLNSFGNIFINFFSMVDIYINFLLNIRDFDLSANVLNTLKSYWTEGAIELIKVMKRAIEINKIDS